MKSQTIIRRVLISEKDYPIMKSHCTICSPHGNRRLYDTCEWRVITANDLLIELLKTNNHEPLREYMAKHNRLSYRRYIDDYHFGFDNKKNVVGRQKHSTYSFKFGWATLTKVKK